MKRERPFLIALFLLALGLRLLAARGMGFWEDDVGTVEQADRTVSLAAFLEPSRTEWHPPLSFLFTRLLVHMEPGHELRARLPFLLVGALAAPLAWAVARRLLERRASAALVAVCVAASPLLGWCDRELRAYALLTPLALGAVLAWLRALDEDRPRDWAAFAVLAALACWDHYNALPFVACLLLIALVQRPRRAILAGVGFAVLYAPWAPGLVYHLAAIPLAEHAERIQLHIPPVPLTAPLYVLYGLLLGHTVFPWSWPIVLPVALAAATLAIAALDRKNARLLVPGLALPILGAAATTFHMPRYFCFAAPLLLIVLAAGAERIARRSPRAAIALAAVISSGIFYGELNLVLGREHHFLYPLRPWAAIQERVARQWAPVFVLHDTTCTATYFPRNYFRDLPFFFLCAPDRVWFLVDEGTTEEEEHAIDAGLRGAGFRRLQDEPVFRDADHAARERWVGRGGRDPLMRMIYYQKGS
jgi:hypothetical protein